VQNPLFNRPFLASLLLCLTWSASPAGAQIQALAVNPVTNKTYVTNPAANSVIVVRGADGFQGSIPISSPDRIAVDPASDKAYVTSSSGTVVIDALRDQVVKTIPNSVGGFIAVDPVIDKVFTFKSGDGYSIIQIIDGQTDEVTLTFNASTLYAAGIAVNPVTHRVYAVGTNNAGGGVDIFDGQSGYNIPIPLGNSAGPPAVDPVTGNTYAGGDQGVWMIDPTNHAAFIPVPGYVPLVAVNPTTGRVYANTFNPSALVEIKESDGSVQTVLSGNFGRVLAVHARANRIYVAPVGANGFREVDPTGTIPAISYGTTAVVTGIAVNPVTNRVIVAGNGAILMHDPPRFDDVVTVTNPNAISPQAVAVDPVRNEILVPNNGSTNATAIIGATNGFSTLACGDYPTAAAVNPITHKFYVANYGTFISNSTVTILDRTAFTTTTVGVGKAPVAVAVNPVTNKVYVANSGSGSVSVIDGATNAWLKNLSTGGQGPSAIDVDPDLNRIYVANFNSNTVAVIDGATDTRILLVPVGAHPSAIAVDPIWHFLYVANSDGASVSVLASDTYTPTTVPVGVNPTALAVNPVSHHVYVANTGSNSVTVIYNGTAVLKTIPDAGLAPIAVAVNPVTNHVYVANRDSANVLVIDGVTDTGLRLMPVGSVPLALGVNPFTNKVYVANNDTGTVSVLEEEETWSVPLRTTITPFGGNTTTNHTPVFPLNATSSYSPNAPAPQEIYTQVDTWQGPWTRALPGSGWTGTTPGSLTHGIHTVYAQATDGQEATSTMSGPSSSPIPGEIKPYLFLVACAPLSVPSVWPAIESFCPGNEATFTVAASGDGTLTYQWRKNGGNLSDGGAVSGSRTATLHIANAQVSDNGTYDVVVQDFCHAPITASSGTLTVDSDPTAPTVTAPAAVAVRQSVCQ